MEGALPINHVSAMRFPTFYRSFKSLLIIQGKENKKRREENEEWRMTSSHIRGSNPLWPSFEKPLSNLQVVFTTTCHFSAIKGEEITHRKGGSKRKS